MRDILDPAGQWLAATPFALRSANKRPVALNDTLTVLKDSGPVMVDVLANDYDPEGAALTLVSAAAALGTATVGPGNAVTYTPPAGISGFDTVVYEIADDLGQIRSAQIDVTIAEPQLSIAVQADNTLVVTAETGPIDITVTEPADFSGTWQADTADLAGGPVNLVPPAIAGTVAEGATLTASGGFWIHDTGAGPPVQSWQWRRAGADIAGATAADYAVLAGDVGQGLSVAETLTDGFGQRSAASAAVGQAFAPADDPLLLGWWDAADTATISATAGAVSAWADKAGGADLSQVSASNQPGTGVRTLNGLNVLDFQGTQCLTSSRSLPVSGDVAFHMALVIDGIANAFAAAIAVETANDFQIDANNAVQFDGRLNLVGTGSPVSLTGGPFSGALIVSAVFDRTGAAQAEVFIGGLSRGATGYAVPIDAAAALHLMTNRSINAWADGAVAELVITGDPSNRAPHHAYLAAKWGLS